MKKFECDVCGFVYDPAKGLPELGIPPGTPFEALPAGFCCPVCGADKASFSPLAPSLEDRAPEPAEVRLTVREVIPRTPTVKSIRFAAPGRAAFRPGQYLALRLENDPGLTRYLTISSSPTEEGYLEVTKRITQSRFSQVLDRVEPGYPVSVTYPMGNFTFEGESEKIAMLSGGIGITPLRSICRYVADKRLATDVCLLYGNRNVAEIAFKAELDGMQAICPRLRVVHYLSEAGGDWNGKTGHIDAAAIREAIPDYCERPFYLCGPPRMVESLTDILRRDLQLPEERIITEGFTGY